MDQAAVDAARAAFIEAVGNDLNTSLGVTAVYDALKADTNDATKRAVTPTLTRCWVWTCWAVPPH